MYRHKVLVGLLALVVSFAFFSDSADGGQSIKFGPVVASEVAGSVFDQSNPVASNNLDVGTLITLTPSDSRLGFGITESTLTNDALPISEPNHIMGMFYNKLGVGGSLDNQFEQSWHGFPRSETNFRSTTATNDHSWVEFNTDFYPPDNDTVVDNESGGWSPLAGQYISFNGGGTGRVISWSGSTLTWRQDSGAVIDGEQITEYTYTDTLASENWTSDLPADGALIVFTGDNSILGVVESYNDSTKVLIWKRRSELEPAASAVVTIVGEVLSLSGTLSGATPSASTDTADVHDTTITSLKEASKWRPYIAVWQVLNGSITHSWRTSFEAATSTLRIAADGVGINWSGNVSPGLQVSNTPGVFTTATIKTVSTSENTDAGVGSPGVNIVTIQAEQDFTGENYNFQNPVHFKIITPAGPLGTGSTLNQAFGIWILDQEGYDGASDVIRIDEQTCAAGGGASDCSTGEFGNLTMLGGDWNTGHIVLGGTGAGGLHLWKDKVRHTLRMRPDHDPSSNNATSGNSIVTGSNLDTHGPAFWGISNAGTLDSGTELCAWVGNGVTPGVGLTCVDVLEFSTVGTPTDSTCAATHSVNVKYLAFCK